MNNVTNIYDIDGEIIRKAGDDHKWTLDEAKERIEMYRKKLSELPEDDPKAVKYTTYMRNLTQYLMSLYAKMTPEDLNKLIEENKAKNNLNEQVKDAMEQLKKDLEDSENDTDTREDTSTEVPTTIPEDNESDTDRAFGDDEAGKWDNSDIPEEQILSQDSLLVERDVNDTIMDEYIEPVTIGGDNDGTND